MGIEFDTELEELDEDPTGLDDDEEIGGRRARRRRRRRRRRARRKRRRKRWGRAFRRAGKAVAKAAKKVVKSPITKGIVTGLSIAYPPAGLPAAAALSAAGKVVDAVDGKRGARLKAAGKRLVANTYKEAKLGDPRAKAGLAQLALAKRLKVVARGGEAKPPASAKLKREQFKKMAAAMKRARDAGRLEGIAYERKRVAKNAKRGVLVTRKKVYKQPDRYVRI